MLNVKKKLALTAALIGGCTLAIAAYAGHGQQGGKGGEGRHHGGGFMFEKMDANKDGTVTKAEITAHVEGRMKESDANGDGKITRAEFDAAQEAKRAAFKEARFKRMDTNGDGQVSEQEFENAKSRRWSKERPEGT